MPAGICYGFLWGDQMRIIRTSNVKENLCDKCLNKIPECNPTVCEFGSGIGNDNIIGCSEYNGKYNKDTIIGEIAPKKKECRNV